jgi:hypothetical protein
VKIIRPLAAVGAATLLLLSTIPATASADPVPASPEASQAESHVAGWVARQLADSDGDVKSSYTGTTDYTQVAYAVIALAGAGQARTEMDLAADFLIAAGDAYVGAPDSVADNWSRVAVVALALDVAGRDATRYPGAAGERDLIADLRGNIGADGSPGTFANPYTASLTAIALSRTDEGAPAELVEWLKAQPCADATSPNYGGFDYNGPGNCDSGDPEATGMAIQGLLAVGVAADDAVVQAAQTYLETNQEASGGWGAPAWSAPANATATGWIVQALRALGSPAVARGEEYLLSVYVGCDLGAESLVGALAYDDATLTALTPDAPDDTTYQSLVESSIQGLLGLGAAPLGEVDGTLAAAAAPAAELCASPAETAPTAGDDVVATDVGAGAGAESDEGGSSTGWYIGGGIALLVLIGAISGVVLSRRSRNRAA